MCDHPMLRRTNILFVGSVLYLQYHCDTCGKEYSVRANPVEEENYSERIKEIAKRVTTLENALFDLTDNLDGVADTLHRIIGYR